MRVTSEANRRAVIALAAIVVACCETQSGFAQDGVTIDVGDCVKLTSPEERFACYEKRANAASAQKAPAPSAPEPARSALPPPAAAPVPPAPSAPTGAAPAVAAGATAVTPLPPAPTPPAPKTAETKNSPPEVVATIKELRETVPNAYLITLDNGQVWQQSYPETYFLRPGMRVTLHGSKWGSSYRLSAEGLNGFIQVKRVK